MSETKQVVPCADCGTLGGTCRKGSTVPKRTSGEKFGFEGLLCHRCYHRLYYSKQRRYSTPIKTARVHPKAKPIVARPYVFDPLDSANQEIVLAISKRFTRSGRDMGDVTSDGQVGLVKACQAFDESIGVPFPKYAASMIHREILLGLGTRAARIRVPRYLNAAALRNGCDSHGNPIRRETLEAARAVREGKFVGDHSLESPLATVVFSREASMAGRDIAEVLDLLPEREATVLRLRYGIGDGQSRTHKEIGSALKAGDSTVRELEQNALAHARRLMGVAS